MLRAGEESIEDAIAGTCPLTPLAGLAPRVVGVADYTVYCLEQTNWEVVWQVKRKTRGMHGHRGERTRGRRTCLTRGMRERSLGNVLVVMRNYFSSYLLWTASRASREAAVIEERHEGESRFDIGHRSHVLTSILAAAAFLEAMVNELYQDAYDDHGSDGDGYIAPLTVEARSRLSTIWQATDEGEKLRPLAKYQLMLMASDQQQLDEGAQTFQDAKLVTQLRNAIAHYQPEDLSVDSPARMEQRLRGKFPDNRLMAGAGNPWWPDHCLGAGCAQWAVDSAIALADSVSDQVGIRPNYIRVRDDRWAGFGAAPTPDEPRTSPDSRKHGSRSP